MKRDVLWLFQGTDELEALRHRPPSPVLPPEQRYLQHPVSAPRLEGHVEPCVHHVRGEFGETAHSRFDDFEDGPVKNRPAGFSQYGTLWVLTCEDCQTLLVRWASLPWRDEVRVFDTPTLTQMGQYLAGRLVRQVCQEEHVFPEDSLEVLCDAVEETEDCWAALFHSPKLLERNVRDFLREFRRAPDRLGLANLWRAAHFHPNSGLMLDIIEHRCAYIPPQKLVATWPGLPKRKKYTPAFPDLRLKGDRR